MSGRPEVAVVIPTYNQEKTLAACLESVYAQTYRPAEVIVVDDASSDRTREIARGFSCTLLALPTNRGPAAARNAGVAAATAPLVFFLDSDTALLPDALANAVRAYQDTPGCGMVQGIYAPLPLFDDGPVEVYRVLAEHLMRRRTTATLFSCSLIPKEVYLAAGGLDERLRDGEDFEFGTRLPAGYSLLVTDRVVTRADDVDRLLPLLREHFTRSRSRPARLVEAWRRRRLAPPSARTGARPGRVTYLDGAGWVTSAATGLGLVALPAAVLTPWALLAVPPLGLAFLAANRELVAEARRLRGVRFAVTAVALHALTNAVFLLGIAAGLPLMVRQALRRPATARPRAVAAERRT